MNLEKFRNHYLKKVDEISVAYINTLNLADILKESILYSYTAGGKRIRPLLLLATLNAFNVDVLKGIHTASALEFIHTSSLIHDDLPAMDNDDYRRGKLTNHKVYGEATAVLAGDALLINALQLITRDQSLPDNIKISLIETLTTCSGANGMIGGQQLDIENEDRVLDLEMLKKIDQHKTGKLLEFALVGGGIIANQKKTVLSILKEASYHIGIAFQIKDDILDVIGNKTIIGKPINSDEKNNKYTYVRLLGLEQSKQHLQDHYEKALNLIHHLNINSHLIEEIFKLIIERDK
ncbi:polyprenyl synthetase family protein [Mycoplasmatota bacterium]|nr:polyprenyl synthetase family protein [Mycoplasmatota bacterium]